MRSALITLIGMVVAVVSPPALAQGDDVSGMLEKIVTDFKVPGMVLVAIEGDKVIASGAAGVRQRGSVEKVTLDDKFHIGSCTKAMTAALCAELVDEGKLSWTSTLADVFPELKGKMHEDYRGVTLEQLLSNRGGFPGDLNEGGLWGRLWNFKGTSTAARRALLEGVITRAPQKKPGTEYLYSNAGFAVAGHMAEQVTKKSWEELMRERLFKPLGMTSAGFGAPGIKGKVDQPRGHSKGRPVEVGPGSDNPAAIGPAGTVHCSVLDWSKFVAEYLGAGKVLKKESLEKLTTPANGPGEKYAMGWAVVQRPWAKGKALTHAGSNTMWYAVAWVAPNRNFAVLVCCNEGTDAAAKACDTAAAGIILTALK